MGPLVVDDGGDVGMILAEVRLLLVALEGPDQLGDRGGPEEPGHQDDEADAQSGTIRRRHDGAVLVEALGPDVRMPALVPGDRPEGGLAARVALDPGQSVVEDDGVAFELQVGEAARLLVGGHAANRTCACHEQDEPSGTLRRCHPARPSDISMRPRWRPPCPPSRSASGSPR